MHLVNLSKITGAMKDVISEEICQNCGICCRNFPFVEVSKHDIHLLEKFTGLSFDKFTNPKGYTDEGYFLQTKENGNCLFLKKTSNGHSCGVYIARPQICRDYPVNIKHWEWCNANRVTH